MSQTTLHKGLQEAEAYLKRSRNGDKQNGTNNSDIIVAFADRVRNLRLSLALSQGQFAAKYALPIRTVQNWEQGRRTKPDASGSLLIGLIERDPEGMAQLVEDL